MIIASFSHLHKKRISLTLIHIYTLNRYKILGKHKVNKKKVSGMEYI